MNLAYITYFLPFCIVTWNETDLFFSILYYYSSYKITRIIFHRAFIVLYRKKLARKSLSLAQRTPNRATLDRFKSWARSGRGVGEVSHASRQTHRIENVDSDYSVGTDYREYTGRTQMWRVRQGKMCTSCRRMPCRHGERFVWLLLRVWSPWRGTVRWRFFADTFPEQGLRPLRWASGVQAAHRSGPRRPARSPVCVPENRNPVRQRRENLRKRMSADRSKI